MSGFLLIVMLGQVPIFVLPMPSADVCAMNAAAMGNMAREQDGSKRGYAVECFNLTNQTITLKQ